MPRTSTDIAGTSIRRLIPRAALFGDPDHLGPRVSPDGRHVSYLAPLNGVMNLFVASTSGPADARPVTRITSAGMGGYTADHYWTRSGEDLLYTLDDQGDERWNVFRVNITSGETLNLTPEPNVHASVEAVGHKRPGEVLVRLNSRDPALHDLYAVELRTGRHRLVMQNPATIDGNSVYGFTADEDYVVRFANAVAEDGSVVLYARDGGRWQRAHAVPPEDIGGFAVEGFDETGAVYYLRDSRGRDTVALYEVEARTGRRRLLAGDDRADIDGVLRHPRTRHVQAASLTYQRRQWQVIDPAVGVDVEYLAAAQDGEMSVTSRSADDRVWTVSYDTPDRNPRHYLCWREGRRTEFLFAENEALERQRLAKVWPVVIHSRDGLDLVSYYLLPGDANVNHGGRPDRPLPTVLVVHGGPALRDGYRFNRVHQWLADRGYAVLAVNFRGSTGLGKRFQAASYLEWGGRMHDDLIDAVRWAVDAKIADPRRVAIMGSSYGGYAALVGLTLTPDTFACAIATSGISRLTSFLDSMPPHWKPKLAIYRAVFGDHTSEPGRAFLDARSPLTFVDRITRPLLIAHGANDPRCPVAEAEQIVAAMAAKGLPVTYVLYPDEGHGLVRPDNRMSFYALAEAFLSRHLGGACEAVGDDLNVSSARVAGLDHLSTVKPLPPTGCRNLLSRIG